MKHEGLNFKPILCIIVLYSTVRCEKPHMYTYDTESCSSMFFERGPKNFASSQKQQHLAWRGVPKNVLVDFEGHKLIRNQNKDTTSDGLDPYPPYARATSAPWQGPDKCALHFFSPGETYRNEGLSQPLTFLRWDSCGFCWQMEFMDSHKISSETKFIPMIPDSGDLSRNGSFLYQVLACPAAFFFGGGGWLADKLKATALEPARWINIAIFGQGHDSQTPNKNWAPWQISDVLVSKGCHFLDMWWIYDDTVYDYMWIWCKKPWCGLHEDMISIWWWLHKLLRSYLFLLDATVNVSLFPLRQLHKPTDTAICVGNWILKFWNEVPNLQVHPSKSQTARCSQEGSNPKTCHCISHLSPLERHGSRTCHTACG